MQAGAAPAGVGLGSVVVGRRGGSGDVADLRALLDGREQTRAWVGHLEAVGRPDLPAALPAADELPAALLGLAVPHEDIDSLVALLPGPRRTPELWWLLERCCHSLTNGMGAVNGPPTFPSLPPAMGPVHRYFYVYVFLAALPHVRAFHRARGVPDEVARLTLADLGRNMALHRRRYGVGGLDFGFWLTLHFRGIIYQLGRLQFERATLGGRTGRAITAAGQPYGPGDPALAVHIPDCYGPLTPRACDESFASAARFFARHFPEERYDVAVCHSWLLDEQLAGYLPADSNIVRFQRRFRTAYRLDRDDEAILRFVFGRAASLDELPRGTALERAVADHLRAGHHWHGGAGWLRL